MSRVVFGVTERVLEVPIRPLSDLLRGRSVIGGVLPGEEASGGPVIAFAETAYLDFLEGAHSDLGAEQVGVFYGHAAKDGDQHWIHVAHALHARTARGTAIHVDLDQHAWADIHNQVTRRGIDTTAQVVVGWWHTHPDLGAFFSGTDKRTQARAFASPWQVGIVIDPVRGEWAMYCGRESDPITLKPIVIADGPPQLVHFPAFAVRLPLPANAPDLGAAAWIAMVKARRGAFFEVFTPADKGRGPGLILDRPQLKRRYPHAAGALRHEAQKDGGWHIALPLQSRDIVAVLARGLLRPPSEFLSRSHT